MKPLVRPAQVKSDAAPEVPCTTVVPVKFSVPGSAGVVSFTTRVVVPFTAPTIISSEVSEALSVASTASVEPVRPVQVVPAPPLPSRLKMSPVWPLRRSTRPSC